MAAGQQVFTMMGGWATASTVVTPYTPSFRDLSHLFSI